MSSWMQPHLTGFASKIGDFLATDPGQYVAGPSDLQTQAFSGASNLGGWQASTDQALQMASAAGANPAATATATGYNAQQAQAANLADPVLAGGATVGPASQGQATLSGYNSILDNGGIAKYMDPAVQAYVEATLANYDANTAQQEAQMMAEGARNKAFGGSRFGLREAEFDASTGRNRALTEAQLRAQAFRDALGAAGLDTGLRQETDISNTGRQTEMSALNAQEANQLKAMQAQLDWNRLAANQDAQNQFALAEGGFQQQANLFNTGAANEASAFTAGAQNTASLTNAQLQEQAYQRALQAAGLTADISNTMATNARADVGTQAAIGDMQRDITQDELNAVPTQLQIAGNLYGMIPGASYIGSKTKNSGGLGTALLGGLAQGVGSAISFSDRRLKSNVVRIGSNGPLGVYSFSYPDGSPHIGVMADEVAIHAPQALGPVIDGYATVDYSKL